MSEAGQKPKHPMDALEEFRYRIRPFDPLGSLLIGNGIGGGAATYNEDDIGRGLISLVEDFEEFAAGVSAWFDEQRAGAA